MHDVLTLPFVGLIGLSQVNTLDVSWHYYSLLPVICEEGPISVQRKRFGWQPVQTAFYLARIVRITLIRSTMFYCLKVGSPRNERKKNFVLLVSFKSFCLHSSSNL